MQGYWPATEKHHLNRETFMSCKMGLTIQVFTKNQARMCPAEPGNLPGPTNTYPTLVPPNREHGSFKQGVGKVLGMVEEGFSQMGLPRL